MTRLVGMLFCLTLLFLATQISLFCVHYPVSALLDSLVQSSLSLSMLHPVVFLPILQFILLQLFAYALLIAWITFLANTLQQLFKLSSQMTYWLGVGCYFLAVILILTLNNAYHPNSFFTELFQNQDWYADDRNNTLLAISGACLGGVTLLGLLHWCWQRKRTTALLCWVGLLVIAWLYKPAASEAISIHRDKPNIILIGLDSLRPDFTGFFAQQNHTTPQIDHFLQGASVITDAFSPLARTYPAWLSILTGKYPKHHLARINLTDAREVLNQEMLSKKLQQLGYETIYATDEPRFVDIDQSYGFDRIIGPKGGLVEFVVAGLSDFPLTNLLINISFIRFLFPYHDGNRAASVTYQPNHFLSLIEQGLHNRQAEKPLFLAIHFCFAHWPYTWAGQHFNPSLPVALRYQASVAALDQQFSQLMTLLEKAGLLKNSMIVLFSDHGTTLGLPNDRVISEKTYIGNKAKLKNLPIYKRSGASFYGLDTKEDFSLDTSYGQGTDVLSLKQNKIILAFRGYGLSVPAKTVAEWGSLIDIAPTLMHILKQPLWKNIDGISLYPYFLGQAKPQPRPIFIETGESLGEIETDKIEVEKIVQKRIHAYLLNPSNGLLYINPRAKLSILEAKQRAVIYGNWLLASYPRTQRLKLIPDGSNRGVKLAVEKIDPFYVMVDLKTGVWTIDNFDKLASRQTELDLKQHLKAFYGAEIMPFSGNSASLLGSRP